MNHTRGPMAPVNMATRAESPDVAMASQQSSGTSMPAICASTDAAGRGAFVTSTTAPPPARNARSAATASGNARTPSCRHPHKSQNSAS